MTWILSKKSSNDPHPLNVFTQGQCGGMCAVWLSRMLQRKREPSLTETWPNMIGGQELGKIMLDTHCSAFRVPSGQYEQAPNFNKNLELVAVPKRTTAGIPKPSPRMMVKEWTPSTKDAILRAPNFKRPTGQPTPLPVNDANQRLVAAAGLTPGTIRGPKFNRYLARELARKPGAYFIDIGGHAIATFNTGSVLASWEPRGRLYFFDPNVGAFFSEDANTFEEKFDEVYNAHNRENPALMTNWYYMRVTLPGMTEKDEREEEDINISSLFA